MNKILLVARREFLTRVQKRTFLLTTILLPLIIFGFYAMIIYFSVSSGDTIKVAVADNANFFNGKLESNTDASFSFLKNETPESLNAKLRSNEYGAYIYVPANANPLKDSIKIISAEKVGLIKRGKIQDELNNSLQQARLRAFNISQAQLDSTKNDKAITFTTISGNKDSDDKEGASYLVGYISGFLIYIILFIYGTMVMRGVMEEKVSRIAEVIVSSVKPFQLMMGKIFGIGAVGLIQFIIWIVLVFGLSFLLPLFFPSLATQMHQAQAVQPAAMQTAQQLQEASKDPSFFQSILSVNWPLIIGCFIFYFLGGYLLYSSLFAAVGSAVNEDPQDAQSLMLPLTMPIIFAIVIMTKAVQDPNSGLAVFGSIFPLTSPIVMMARIAHGVPDGVTLIQLIISMALLIGGFLGTTWIAAKIYRTGILLYGKKITWKEMWKWAFRKN